MVDKRQPHHQPLSLVRRGGMESGNVILNPDGVGMKDLVFVIKKRFFVPRHSRGPQNDSESQ